MGIACHRPFFSTSRINLLFNFFVLFLLFGLTTNAQQKTRLRANAINDNKLKQLRDRGVQIKNIKYDTYKTTEGEGVISCMPGITYKYKVTANSYTGGGAAMMDYLDDARFSLSYTNNTRYFYNFKLYTKPLNGHFDTLGMTDITPSKGDKPGGGLSASNYGITLSANEKMVTLKICGYIEVKEWVTPADGIANFKTINKQPCNSTITIKLPPALKEWEIEEGTPEKPTEEAKLKLPKSTTEEEEKELPNKNKESKDNGNPWNGRPTTASKTAVADNNDPFNGKPKGEVAEQNNPDDKWNGFSEEDIKVNYKAKQSDNRPNLYGYVNERGGTAIDYMFVKAYDFKENMGKVRLDNGYGFVNKNGKVITKEGFEDARDFANGMAAVMLKNKWGFINKTGQLVVPCIYDRAENFNSSVAKVVQFENKLESRLSNGCSADEYILLKSILLINKTNSVIQRDKRYEIRRYIIGIGPIILSSEPLNMTAEERSAREIEAERQKEIERNRVKRCNEEERIAMANLKSQAAAAGYKEEESNNHK